MSAKLARVDPFNYTVQQIIQLLSPHLSPEHVRSLQLNEVDGRVLLKTASYDTLKSELGIIPLGRRERIMEIVCSLRRESDAYRDYLAQISLPPDEDGDLKEIVPLYLPPTTSCKRKRESRLQLQQFEEPRSPPTCPRFKMHTPLPPLKLWARNTPLHLRFLPEDEEALIPYVSVNDQLQPVYKESQPTVTGLVYCSSQGGGMESVSVLPNEQQPTKPETVKPTLVTLVPAGDDDVKVRALNGLPSLSDVDYKSSTPKRKTPIVVGIDDVRGGEMDMDIESMETRPTSRGTPCGPKRAVSITAALIADLEDAETDITDSEPQARTAIEKKGASAKRYLAPKGRKIESLFYDVPPGDDIPLDYDKDDEFQLVPSHPEFPGERRYIGRRICRLLKDNAQIIEGFSAGYATGSAAGQLVRIVHQGRPRVAIKHYDNTDRYLRKYEYQSFTVFDVVHGGVRAHRESSKSLHLPWPSPPELPPSSTLEIQIVRHADQPQVQRPIEINYDDGSLHDFDYLIKWQNIDGADEVLPVFGESDEEGEYDEKTWREYQAEFGPKDQVPTRSRNRVYLTKEEVEGAIEDGIKDVIQKWRVRTMPKKEAKDAYRLWRLAKKYRNQKQNIKEARDGIYILNERLSKMRAEFLKSEMNWSSAGLVRKQVHGSMEQTIFDREDLKWVIGLMGRTEQPVKPPSKEKARAEGVHKEGEEPSTGNQFDSTDEETVGSSSEDDFFNDSEGDDKMDGFITSDPKGLDVVGDAGDVVEDDSRSSYNSSDDDSSVIAGPPKRRRRMIVEDSEDNDDDHVEMDSSPPFPSPFSQHIKPKKLPATPSSTIIGGSNFVDLTVDDRPRFKLNVPIVELSDTDSDTSSTDGQHVPSSKEPKGKGKSDDYQLGSTSGRLERLDQSRKKPATPSPEDPLPQERYDALRSFLDAEIEESEYLMVYHQIRDLDREGYEMWFYTKIMDGLHGFHQTIPLPTLQEKELARITCRLYTTWLFHRSGVTSKGKISPHELVLLNNIDYFKGFTNDLVKIIKELPNDMGNKVNIVSQHRKRKRMEVIEDQAAKIHRDEVQRATNLLQRRRLVQERKARTKGEVIGGGKILLNGGHYANYKDIFVRPDGIGEILKPHQIEGIRFLWAQLILIAQNRGKRNETGREGGALLAHTMGLGKTLQVQRCFTWKYPGHPKPYDRLLITFLYTLAEAGASKDKAVYDQIPPHLRKSKTLILSPPGLIENWWDEFHNWLPVEPDQDLLSEKYIGQIYRVTSQVAMHERLDVLDKWNVNGGILLMGYNMFRELANPRAKGQQPIKSDQLDIRKILLEGPNIIVADEAHHLKNPTALITQLTREFKSFSRIAMTGSPLSNNLEEYWSMIEWIDPGFLGPQKEFKQKYVGPISDGLWADSCYEEKRLSLKMLKVLKNEISVKIHRAGIDAIKDDMPPKTEFMLTIPLTDLQTAMYRRFIESTAAIEQGSMVFLGLVDLLSLICSHPAIFVRHIESKEASEQKILATANLDAKQPQNLNIEDEDIAEDLQNDFFQDASLKYDWVRPLLNSYDGGLIEHSYKMLAFRDILIHSAEIGDSTLVFTHSIPTLDVLEAHVKEMDMKYFRLDGLTPMKDRQQSAKRFNMGSCSVFLISTQAGGLGLNLFGANRVIIFDYKWSPMWEQQAVGRAYRLGQTKHVFVYRFRSGGTLQDKMWNTAQFKSQLTNRVVDNKAAIREAVKMPTKYFAPPTEVPQQDLTVFGGKDVILDRLIEANYVRAIEHTETFMPDIDDVLNDDEQKEVEELLKQNQALREQEMRAKAVPCSAPVARMGIPFPLAPPLTAPSPTGNIPPLVAPPTPSMHTFSPPSTIRTTLSPLGNNMFGLTTNKGLPKVFKGSQKTNGKNDGA